MAKMTVYHGGYMAVEHPEIRKGRNTKDFGTGFYCTIIKEQAQRWAKRYDTKIVSIYDVRLDSSLKIKDFREMTDEWLDFIAACRNGVPHDYDVVEGPMADDTIFNVGSIPFQSFARAVQFKCCSGTGTRAVGLPQTELVACFQRKTFADMQSEYAIQIQYFDTGQIGATCLAGDVQREDAVLVYSNGVFRKVYRTGSRGF